MEEAETRIHADWNVVVTVFEGEFRAARDLLRQWGSVAASDFHNVLVMRVDDPAKFAHEFAGRVAEEPGLMNILSHVVPAVEAFRFQTAEEFDERSRQAALHFAPALAGKRFHVRVHRRGFHGRISSKDEEQQLDRIILDALEASGTPGAITFEDPDRILAIEMVGQRAGVSLWSRDELNRYPFLGLD